MSFVSCISFLLSQRKPHPPDSLLQEENGGPYKGSIPLSQATNPEADVLLAYEMNGEVIYTYLHV